MTEDTNVYRLGKLCNTSLSRRREAVRWLRGRTYQAEMKAERLRFAWPDRDSRTADQEAAIKRADVFAASCRAALAHHQQLLMHAMEADAYSDEGLAEWHRLHGDEIG